MATNIKISGNFIVASDTDTLSDDFRLPRNNARYIYSEEGLDQFFEFFPISYMEGVTFVQQNNKFNFSNIIDDRTGAAFTSTDELKDFLDENLGDFFLDDNPALRTPFNELITAEKSTVIELKSIYGLSDIRDNTVTTGTGAVTNAIGDREYTIQVSGSSSSARLESVERGRYISGKAAEYGMGVRLSSDTFTGDTVAKWGAINVSNGLYFGQDSTGKFVAILDNSTENKIYQSNWNVDKLDGSGSSARTLNTTDGQVYNIEFTWYGYGVVTFVVWLKDDTGEGLVRVVVHRYVIDGQTSIQTPNLPLTAEIKNGTATDTESIYVGGRQFSVLGRYSPSYRATSEIVTGKSVPTTGLTPIISFRQKTAYKVVNGKVEGTDTLTDERLLLEIYVGATLTGASFGTPTRKLVGETAFESDTSATSVDVSAADLLYRTIIPGGSGNSKAVGEEDLRQLILDIPENLDVTLVAQSLGASAASIDSVFRIREEW